MSEPVLNQITAVVRTLVQMLWGVILAYLVAIPALEPYVGFIDNDKVELAVVGFCTAFIMSLVAFLVHKVSRKFGYLFVIPKKPVYVEPPAPAGP